MKILKIFAIIVFCITAFAPQAMTMPESRKQKHELKHTKLKKKIKKKIHLHKKHKAKHVKLTTSSKRARLRPGLQVPKGITVSPLKPIENLDQKIVTAHNS